MTALNALFIAALALAAAALIAAPLQSEAPQTGAAAEIQLGPVILSFAGAAPISLSADSCLRRGCPLLELRARALSAAASQSAPGQPGRVQRLQPALFEGGRLSAEQAGEMLGEQGRMDEAAGAETAEDERPVKTRFDPIRR